MPIPCGCHNPNHISLGCSLPTNCMAVPYLSVCAVRLGPEMVGGAKAQAGRHPCTKRNIQKG